MWFLPCRRKHKRWKSIFFRKVEARVPRSFSKNPPKCRPTHFDKIHYLYLGKMAQNEGYFCIFQKRPKVNNRTFGENSSNLVTLAEAKKFNSRVERDEWGFENWNRHSSRVARWIVFKPKIPIWVNFVGSYIGKCLYILWPFGIFYGDLRHFRTIWYSLYSFGTFFSGFGTMCEERSGNPALERNLHPVEISWNGHLRACIFSNRKRTFNRITNFGPLRRISNKFGAAGLSSKTFVLTPSLFKTHLVKILYSKTH
jgi:hypothetical protein